MRLSFTGKTPRNGLAIGANDELRRQIFPEKKKLGLKAKTDEDMNLLNAEEDEIPAVTVDEMLAAAEGDTDETRHVKDKVRLQEKAAAMSLPRYRPHYVG